LTERGMTDVTLTGLSMMFLSQDLPSVNCFLRTPGREFPSRAIEKNILKKPVLSPG
jgi:hypothetical protein